PEGFVDAAAMEEIAWLMKFISEIRSVRADMNVPAGARIDLLVKDASDQTRARIETYDAIIRQMARLEKIELSNAAAAAGSIQCIVGEATLIMPVADIIDLDKERERLNKQIAKLQDDIEKIEAKL